MLFRSTVPIAASVAMAIFMAIWRLAFSDDTIMGTVAAIAISAIYAFLYKDDIRNCFFARGKTI